MLSDWIVVLDDDPVSRAQRQVCEAQRPDFRGAVQCDDADNARAPVCSAVEKFPAFCHVERNACVYGFRTDFSELLQAAPPSNEPLPTPRPHNDRNA